MTNGEKVKAMFPSMIIGFITESQIGIYFVKNQHSATVFSLDWWNAEYKTEKCKWIKYDYRTMCPKEHDAYNPYWRIPENMMGALKYCPYCGKEIEVEK